MARFARPGTEHLQLFTRDDMGVEVDGACIAIMPQNKIFSPVTTHFQAFLNRAWDSDAFQHHIRAVTASEVADRCQTRCGVGTLVDIDRDIGSKAFGDLESMFGSANNDDLPRTCGLCDG
jgi:hypothetical protein